jgi:hypothetical protein
LITELADFTNKVTEGAKAFKAVADFALTVAGLLKLTRNNQATLAAGKQLRGQRSVEAILEAAINSGHEIELKHTTRAGDIMDLKVTPVEATKIRERNRMRIEQMESAYRKLPPPDPPYPVLVRDNAPARTLPAQDFLQALIDRDGSEDVKDAEIEALIIKLTETLRHAGLDRVLTSMADELEASGHLGLGQRLRREARS